MHPFHEEVQKYFPNFDYHAPAGDPRVLLDYSNPDNKVGHQQRAFSVYWALKKCAPMDLGLDLGSPKGMTPLCIHVDIFGDGTPHPHYGGGPYKADFCLDAARIAELVPADSVPFINSNHSLEHMPNVGDGGIVSILRSWWRLLRADGILALVIPDNAYFDVLKIDPDHKHAWSHKDFPERVLHPFVLVEPKADIIEFDTFQNKFSFNAVLRKRA